MEPKAYQDLRERLNMTRPELAELLGFSRQAIWQWETGRRAIPEYAQRAMVMVESISMLFERVFELEDISARFEATNDELARAERFQRGLAERLSKKLAEVQGERMDGAKTCAS